MFRPLWPSSFEQILSNEVHHFIGEGGRNECSVNASLRRSRSYVLVFAYKIFCFKNNHTRNNTLALFTLLNICYIDIRFSYTVLISTVYCALLSNAKGFSKRLIKFYSLVCKNYNEFKVLNLN